MAAIKEKYFRKVERLYRAEYSARQIADQLEVSIDAVYYVLRRQGIPRRNPTEQSRILFSRKVPSYTLKKRLNVKEQHLLVAGVMLYWGEGSQWNGETSVDFANSRPDMVKVFLQFLRVICGVDEQRLRCYLYCYSNQNILALTRYWSKQTQIPKMQFTKPYVRTDFDETKINKMPYGLIHIRYSDKQLLLQLRQWIDNMPKELMS